jgi:hypothetical protein
MSSNFGRELCKDAIRQAAKAIGWCLGCLIVSAVLCLFLPPQVGIGVGGVGGLLGLVQSFRS